MCNIVALRGDPGRGQDTWEIVDGGFNCALDLQKYVTSKHCDYFSRPVADYTEGHPNDITEVEGGAAVRTEYEMRRACVVTDESGI